MIKTDRKHVQTRSKQCHICWRNAQFASVRTCGMSFNANYIATFYSLVLRFEFFNSSIVESIKSQKNNIY